MLTYEQARQTVIETVGKLGRKLAAEEVALRDAQGRVLAQDLASDRDYPPFDRATRDGFAVRAADAAPGAKLPIRGEIKAGDTFAGELARGTCVQIMTGAAVPCGADAVVMVEHVEQEGNAILVTRETLAGQHIVPRGREARSGQILLKSGQRLGVAEMALAAQIGATTIRCAKKPRVAILSTGNELVDPGQTPGPFQIRGSNSLSIAAQARLAGGEAVLMGNALDDVADLREKISAGLREDLLVLSGGVSMGKYDLVENVLRELGAELCFDAVAIRPGKPAVFGLAGETPVFGLPGNPISTMVTFELFVAPAIDLLSGAPARHLPLLRARLGEPMREKSGLMHFLPARLEWLPEGAEVKPLPWQGSGDIAALAHANCFLVVPAACKAIEAGEMVSVLLRKEVV